MKFSSFAFFTTIVTSIFSFEVEVFEYKVNEFQKPTSWAHKSIEKSLALWKRDNFLESSLNDVLKKVPKELINGFSVITIKNNFTSIKPVLNRNLNLREKTILHELNRISKIIKLPDISLILSSEDSFDDDYPVLTFAKDKKNKSILIPDFEALAGYEILKRDIITTCLKCDWNRKKSTIFWRGSFTGGDFNRENFLSFPRSKAVDLSIKDPSLLDARFIEQGQISEDDMLFLKSLGMVTKFSKVKEALKYKYLLDIDGNSCCYSRTYWILLSNSVLLKVASNNVQWYYDLLEDGINYVKICEDYSNLESVLNFLKSNDKLAYKIACQAADMAYEELSQEANLAYFYSLIKAIADLKIE